MKPRTARALTLLRHVRAEKRKHRTDDEIAAALELTRGRVSQLNRVLRLPEKVIDLIETGDLSVTHALLLTGLDDAGATQRAVECVRNRWSIKRLKHALGAPDTGRVATGEGAASGVSETSDPNVRSLETELGEVLGTQVAIRGIGGARGGWLMLRWFDHEHLDGLLERVRGDAR